MATNKYTDIEIKTAENLLKEGYKWIKKSRLGSILAYEIKPTENPETFIPGTKVCTAYVSIFEGIKFGDEPTSLESIVHPQILDDAERKYLSAVIKPFRKRVEYISKKEDFDGPFDCPAEFIHIELSDGDIVVFPDFKANTMYKGMKLGHKYSLEELGL